MSRGSMTPVAVFLAAFLLASSVAVGHAQSPAPSDDAPSGAVPPPPPPPGASVPAPAAEPAPPPPASAPTSPAPAAPPAETPAAAPPAGRDAPRSAPPASDPPPTSNPWDDVSDVTAPSFLDTTDPRRGDERPPPLPEQVQALEEMEAEVARFASAGGTYRGTVVSLVRREYLRQRRGRDQWFARQIRVEEGLTNEARERAIALFERFIRRYPNDAEYTPDAMFRLGELYFERSAVGVPGASMTRPPSARANGRGRRDGRAPALAGLPAHGGPLPAAW